MGYPPSQHGYRVCDVQTHQFFLSSSVIFDENIHYYVRHEVTSDADYSSLPLGTDPSSDVPSPPVTPPHAHSPAQVPP